MTAEKCSIHDALTSAGIPYTEYCHPPVHNMEEMAASLSPEALAKGALVKNLFLYDKKKRYYLLSAMNDSNPNLKTLATKLNAPGLRMADGSVLEAKLGVTAGSVTPLAVINDPGKAVTVVFDEKIKEHDNILVHPLHNKATLLVAKSDVIKFIELQSHSVLWLDLTPPPADSSARPATPSGLVAGGGKNVDAASKASPSKKTGAKGATSAPPTDASQMGISVPKQSHFPEWYTQVICKAEMVQYYDISGCYIIRPWAFFIWEQLQSFIDSEIKKLGVQNAYFPMFVTKNKLEVEQSHVEGFSPEVAWVTKYGDTELSEPVAIRPTSETIMYPAYSKWIRSHRDLPLKLNQWNTVVRWEFKQPTPFIRTREFLWQEGHTAHETDKEAEEFTFTILDIYARAYESLLAVPVVRGTKSEGEKFAGAKMTSTVEGFIPACGRGVQAATSHHLGTNFSKMFNINFEDKDRQKQLVHQTSWGFTTRSIGVMTMVHGDDDGLVLPPNVASKQVVIVPILYKDKDSREMIDRCDKLSATLQKEGVRVEIDDRDNYTPGWKYNYWEVKGVPLRMEFGPRDMTNEGVRLVRRDNKEKRDVKWSDIGVVVPLMLKQMQSEMLDKARRELDAGIVEARNWDEVLAGLNNRKLVMAPWCGDEESEEVIKAKTSGAETHTTVAAVTEGDDDTQGAPLSGAMKALCFPLEQRPLESDAKCFVTQKPAAKWCLFGRSY